MITKAYTQITASFLAILVLFSSCASIVSRSNYPLTIKSTPPNAIVSITDRSGKEIFLGKSPVVVTLKAGDGFFRRAEYQVKFSTPGYDDRIIPIGFSLDGWYWGNLLLGGILGMLIIDPATGAMWRMDTLFLNEKLDKSTAYLNPEMKIMDIKDIPEDWKAHIVKLD